MLSYFVPHLDRAADTAARTGMVVVIGAGLRWLRPTMVATDWVMRAIVTGLMRWLVYEAKVRAVPPMPWSAV
jgi:hypothetical protein